MNITVTLNTNSSPALTITPDEDHVSANANVLIRWTRGATGDAFTFTELAGLSGGPFSGLNLTNNAISINDNNTGIFGNHDYPYALTVTAANGARYTANAASGNPRIRNN